uniref:Uncharacterized protein n=1 Tax=Drosophila melanogaster TaxID=7227 RepID=A0A0B4LFN2_DROME|nr:uncharacterized protein Dmel_CG45087 [Drosophila melanogaster]AHN56371.1 uncharacterized protein Dmel_CG45087 [Drosophila melanogaster]|eukprot:NP_001286576.1 uncharacterized protein Dmel_CG45087 [Drosophila melanogaster]
MERSSEKPTFSGLKIKLMFDKKLWKNI